MTCEHTHVTRRGFVNTCLGCGAYVSLALAAGDSFTRRAFASQLEGEPVTTEPWARVEKLADGLWAIISTPWDGESKTVSNGGIIAGRDGVMVIEGFNTFEGGKWASEMAHKLTGRAPTHVVLTHLHGDHSNGLSGYLASNGDRPQIITTDVTRTMLAERSAEQQPDAKAGETTQLRNTITLPDALVSAEAETRIDLGGKIVRLVPRAGHSPSDLTIELESPNVIWCGDLVFNGTFPYYGDALPSKLSASCKAMITDKSARYVPGHGSVASHADLMPYIEMLDHVGDAAKRAFEKGTPASDAWQAYEIPARLGEYRRFRPDVYRFAFVAWERELKGE